VAERRTCAWLGCDLPADGELEVGEFRLAYCSEHLAIAIVPSAERAYDPALSAWRGPESSTERRTVAVTEGSCADCGQVTRGDKLTAVRSRAWSARVCERCIGSYRAAGLDFELVPVDELPEAWAGDPYGASRMLPALASAN